MAGDSFKFDTCKVKRLPVGPLEANCYVVSALDGGGTDAMVIDPGGDALRIEKTLKRDGLRPRYLINTHGHFDHVGANAELKEHMGGEIAMHPLDVPLLESASSQSSFFGMDGVRDQPAPDILLEDGMELAFGGLTVRVMHTPGHSRGGVCLYIEADGVLFTGDTLFAGSIGRTDLEGGSYDTLIRSIRGKIAPLGDGVTVFPGHGPETTMAEERETNPFVAGEDY